VELGVIIKPHGVQGELKVRLHNASSGEQEQNDGYGLTLVGVA